jgi:hypothetical protein
MSSTQNKQILTVNQVREIQAIIQNEISSPTFQNLLTEDRGASIIGEGIDADVMLPRKRNPRRAQIFTQRFTQGDQPKAIQHLIEWVEAMMPEVKGLLKYNCGRMG